MMQYLLLFVLALELVDSTGCDPNPCGGCGICLADGADYFCVCNGPEPDKTCPAEPVTPPEPEECEPGIKISQTELGVDGTFEELTSIATSATNNNQFNSNVKAGGWRNGAGSCDSWMAPVPVHSGTASTWSGLSSGQPASPQGGVFAACRGAETMIGSFQNMEVGQKYVLEFFQSNSGQTPHTKVGDSLRWQITMKSGADGQVFKGTPMKYDGAGSQKWMKERIEFTARGTTVEIEFEPNEWSSTTVSSAYEVMAADGLVMMKITEEEVPCSGCPLGFTGFSCETGPACSDDVCYNGGTCVIEDDAVKCNCAPGYSGIDCLTASCDPNPCTAASGGECFTNNVSVVCNYPGEWGGKDCDVHTLPKCQCPSFESGSVDGSEMCEFNGRDCALKSGNPEWVDGCPTNAVHCALSLDTHSIGGSVTGLNPGDDITLTLKDGTQETVKVQDDGTFTLPKEIDDGSEYSITVSSSPEGTTCTVSNGSGTATGDVTDVAIECTAEDDNTHSIGGSVTGLNPGDDITLTLKDGTQETVKVQDDGTFKLPKEIDDGSEYSITVASLPEGTTCTVSNGSGTATGDVNDVVIECTAEDNSCSEPDWCSSSACDAYCHAHDSCPCSCPGMPSPAPTINSNDAPTAAPTVCVEDDWCADTPCDQICDDSSCSCTCSSEDCTIMKALKNRDVEGTCTAEECSEDSLPDCTGSIAKITEVSSHGIGCCPTNCKFICNTDTEEQVGDLFLLSVINGSSSSGLHRGLALVGIFSVLYGVYCMWKQNKHGEFQPILDNPEVYGGSTNLSQA